ncbi:D-alanine--D-alanine ligase [Shimazuella sp. AN120528]|uniref:D-alanine--D-alanine ligase family protein n=1 Tax=Shimazuella soli TaxID=1892854 RepID=UPI001F10D559|nr:D-alanine--D-alanine ligase family protein [Shimazuella soli]MCH5584659.1 D-alanine--D-alanine ligase [Shimazuella soli]
MSKKKCVAIVFGGKSGEHDVSLLSASSVLQALDRSKYIPLLVGISKTGEWLTGEEVFTYLSNHLDAAFLDQLRLELPDVETYRGNTFPSVTFEMADVVFPVLHGTFGEDGTIQGMLEMLNIPYAGAGVLASATGMDKAISKVLFKDAGLAQAKYLVAQFSETSEAIIQKVEHQLGYPCFVKPANLGSSVGISKAENRDALETAISTAREYDRKIVIEEFVPAREIEVAVLGNENPKASNPGEIISSNDYYDYEAKYISGTSQMQIPAILPESTLEQIREMAITAFQAIDGSGLARVDFFVHKNSGQIYINEINTMPGFTAYSMYPKMWEESGLAYTDLITELIELGIQRHRLKLALNTSR